MSDMDKLYEELQLKFGVEFLGESNLKEIIVNDILRFLKGGDDSYYLPCLTYVVPRMGKSVSGVFRAITKTVAYNKNIENIVVINADSPCIPDDVQDNTAYLVILDSYEPTMTGCAWVERAKFVNKISKYPQSLGILIWDGFPNPDRPRIDGIQSNLLEKKYLSFFHESECVEIDFGNNIYFSMTGYLEPHGEAFPANSLGQIVRGHVKLFGLK